MDNNRVKELLARDSSYQVVSELSDTPLGKILFALFKGKPQSELREVYEKGARAYYELGFKDGKNSLNRVINNVSDSDYALVMKLLSLMGLSFTYFEGLPLIQQMACERIGMEPAIPFHPGLNLVQDGENHIPEDAMNKLRNFVEQLFLDTADL